MPKRKWSDLSFEERLYLNQRLRSMPDHQARTLPVTMAQLNAWGACGDGRRDAIREFGAQRKPMQVSVNDLIAADMVDHAEWLYQEVTERAEREQLYNLKPEGKWRRPAKDSGITANNTWIQDDGIHFRCQLHKTVIVEFDWSAHLLTLRDGGYQTMTTRGRISQCMDFLGLQVGICTERGKQYLSKTGYGWGDSERLEFIDGMNLKVLTFTGCKYGTNITSEVIDGRQAKIRDVGYDQPRDYSKPDTGTWEVTLLRNGKVIHTSQHSGRPKVHKSRATKYGREASEWTSYDNFGRGMAHGIAENWVLNGERPKAVSPLPAADPQAVAA